MCCMASDKKRATIKKQLRPSGYVLCDTLMENYHIFFSSSKSIKNVVKPTKNKFLKNFYKYFRFYLTLKNAQFRFRDKTEVTCHDVIKSDFPSQEEKATWRS